MSRKFLVVIYKVDNVLFHNILCDKSDKSRIYICPEITAGSVTTKSILQLVKYCVAHYRINWVCNGDINSDSILCILITCNWPIPVNSIKISFLLKNAIQTLRHAVNFLRHEFCFFFFRQSKKIETQSCCLSTIKVSAESNDSGVKAWLILLTNCFRMR